MQTLDQIGTFPIHFFCRKKLIFEIILYKSEEKYLLYSVHRVI